VRVSGRCYGSRVNHPNKFIERLGRRRAELGRNCAIRDRIHIIHSGELSGRSLRIQSRVIASDMTNADNTNPQIFHPLRAVNPKAFGVNAGKIRD
jgi:acetyltransferase-like isoleucine patch superfamily enzyme